MSRHRVLAQAIKRANRGCDREDPPTDDAVAVLRTKFMLTVLATVPSRRYMPPEYEWIVIDDRSGQRVYTVSAE
jgi:hypothetical protein